MNSPQSGKGSFSQSANLVDRIGGMGEELIPVLGFRQPEFFHPECPRRFIRIFQNKRHTVTLDPVFSTISESQHEFPDAGFKS